MVGHIPLEDGIGVRVPVPQQHTKKQISSALLVYVAGRTVPRKFEARRDEKLGAL